MTIIYLYLVSVNANLSLLDQLCTVNDKDILFLLKHFIEHKDLI